MEQRIKQIFQHEAERLLKGNKKYRAHLGSADLRLLLKAFEVASQQDLKDKAVTVVYEILNEM